MVYKDSVESVGEVKYYLDGTLASTMAAHGMVILVLLNIDKINAW